MRCRGDVVDSAMQHIILALMAGCTAIIVWWRKGNRVMHGDRSRALKLNNRRAAAPIPK